MKKIDEKTVLTIRRVACVILLAALLGAFFFCYFRFGKQLWNWMTDVDKLKAWIDGFGAWSSIVFVAVRTMQTVVKFIPAEPLEIGSGLAFGAVGGSLLCLLGSMLGTVIILLLTRKLGTRILTLFRLDDKVQNLKFLQDKEKRNSLIFLFYLIPGTPKDVLSYCAGLTSIRLPQWLLITSLCRVPSIVTSTLGGDALGAGQLIRALWIFAATICISLAGLALYRRLCRAKEETNHGNHSGS